LFFALYPAPHHAKQLAFSLRTPTSVHRLRKLACSDVA
jgi:hypothetical protein